MAFIHPANRRTVFEELNDTSRTCSFVPISAKLRTLEKTQHSRGGGLLIVSFPGAAAAGTFSFAGCDVRTAAFLLFAGAAAGVAAFGEQLFCGDSQRASLKDDMMRWVSMSMF
jgi:hypothetical protein